MKPFRLLLLIAGALVVLLALAVAVVFNSSFQTWVTRRTLASRPGMQTTVGSVSAGLKRVDLKGLRFVRGNVVLTIPAMEIELPVFAAGWRKKVFVTHLVAKGWTLEISEPHPLDAPAQNSTPGAAAPGNVPSSGGPAATPEKAALQDAAAMAAQGFAGVFGQLELPFDASLDEVQLEGTVILPDARGTMKVTLSGGGLGVGREGAFDVTAVASLHDPAVSTLEVRGGVVAAMNTPRSFTRLSAKLDAVASGPKFPKSVKLRADLSAARVPTGETYSAAVITEGQEILSAKAEFPRDARQLGGTWKLDMRDADIAPFSLGQPMPAFTAVGEGRFDTDGAFSTLHVLGRLNTTLDRLQVIRPELEAIGELKVTADFDLAKRGGVIAVNKIESVIQTTRPVASLRTLQPFEINSVTAELRTIDPTRELLGIGLQGLPVAWIQPFLKTIEIRGSELRGDLVVTTRSGGLTLRSNSPLMVDDVAISQGVRSFARHVNLATNVSVDYYTGKGWQAEINGLTAKSGDATLLSLDAKAGQLAGADQPIKASGKLTGNLPGLLAQPAAEGALALTAGDAAVDFVLSLNSKDEIQARIALTNLATTTGGNAVSLPSISTDLRADVSAEGKIAFNAPIMIEHHDRKSDVTLIGTLSPVKDKSRAIDAEVTSTQFVIDDAQILAAALPARADSGSTTPTASRDVAPLWAGFHGSLTLQLKSVVYSDALQMSNVTGRLRIDEGMLKLEGLQTGLGETGRANLNGTVTFDNAAPQPYALAADLTVKEFDPAPLFRALNGNQPPTVEGKFDVASKLSSHAGTLADLTAGAGGTSQVTSKGGVFRGLPVSVSNITETTGKFAALLASAGSAISALTGKKESTDIASKSEAIAEMARGLNPIPYDQLSVVITRDAALNTTFKNFTLIAPEVRLSGNGTALHKPGASLLEDSMAMEFALRVRGRQGELLKYLGALDAQTDDLGYASCTVPLKTGGTLIKPDTSELNGKLAALAIEKSGFGTELLNKIRGVR